MKLIVNSKEDSLETHKENDIVKGYLFYKLNGDLIGFYGKDSETFPKSNYEFVVNINGESIAIDKFNNLYQLDDGTYIIGHHFK